MKDAQKLKEIFQNNKASLHIPLYQRKYSWKKEHCKRLFQDLLKIYDKKTSTHFFGSIVTKRKNEYDDDIWIIDGQQRITTISLIVIAAIIAEKNGIIKCGGDAYCIEEAKHVFLISKIKKSKGERYIKLCPIEEDRDAYDKLVMLVDEEEQSDFILDMKSNIMSNYQYLYDLIVKSKESITFEDLIEALERLTIIDIRLDSSDDPQLIFESLNSCGKDLEEADKVRNYLLMSESPEDQEEYYYKYWSKIEKNTNGEPTMFIRDFLTIKNKTICKIDNLYFEFKQYHEDKNISREELLHDMLKFSVYYSQVYNGNTGKEKIDKKLKQLASIGSNVCMPFYMILFDYAKENNIGDDTIYNVLDVTENYWARRIICGQPANALEKIFASLHSNVMKIYDGEKRRDKDNALPYDEIIKYLLLSKQKSGEFPNDAMVKEFFPIRQIYKLQPKEYRVFLFERMENLNSKEQIEIVQKMNEGSYTIEHIMPQKLSPQWKKELGDNAEEIHQKYLHTFANLTLTAYNAEYGNRPYKEKREGYIKKKHKKQIPVDGFNSSHFRLSEYMKSHTQFGEKELEERGAILLQNFLQLWPMISTQYIPAQNVHVSLEDEDVDYTYRVLVGYTLNGEHHEVGKWKEMYINVCKTLYQEYEHEMDTLALKETNLRSKSNPYTSEISPSCHIWTGSDTKAKINSLRGIFDDLKIPQNELEFELKPLSNDGNIEEEEEEED